MKWLFSLHIFPGAAHKEHSLGAQPQGGSTAEPREAGPTAGCGGNTGFVTLVLPEQPTSAGPQAPEPCSKAKQRSREPAAASPPALPSQRQSQLGFGRSNCVLSFKPPFFPRTPVSPSILAYLIYREHGITEPLRLEKPSRSIWSSHPHHHCPH